MSNLVKALRRGECVDGINDWFFAIRDIGDGLLSVTIGNSAMETGSSMCISRERLTTFLNKSETLALAEPPKPGEPTMKPKRSEEIRIIPFVFGKQPEIG
jgi:hypothetical protein